MQTRILLSSYVLNFLDIDFNSRELENTVNLFSNELVKKSNVENLDSWEIHFVFRCNNTKNILVYTKAKSYTKEKYKEITIHIPIPTNDIAKWGVSADQHIHKINHLDRILGNFTTLDVDYTSYNNRSDYLLDSMIRSVDFCFDKGFTINGIRIKLENKNC
jgi:hypothetical protein